MGETSPKTALCLASDEKGAAFIRPYKRQGRSALLVAVTRRAERCDTKQ